MRWRAETADHSLVDLWDSPAKGTYGLIVDVPETGVVEVGRLGRVHVDRGRYVYVGSGFGPGGVAARVRRHLRTSGIRHWHIDYLRPNGTIGEVWWTCDPVRREHDWAFALNRTTGTRVAIPGFGSSDCGCVTHLFHGDDRFSLDRFASVVNRDFPDHGEVHRLSLAARVPDPGRAP